MDIKKEAFKFALQNAVQFSGKPNPGAVIGKLLSQDPSLKENMKETSKIVQDAIKEVSKLSVEEQKTQLARIDSSLLEKKKVEKRGLIELKNAVDGKVVTRIPPEPSKYPHVGHALSFLINYMYAEKYKGKCILRYEDTNPVLARQEYVDAINEGLEYLEIKPSKTIFVSDDMQLMYDSAQKLIESGNVYVCTCPAESMSALRRKGEDCPCRNKDNHLDEWKKMLRGEYEDGAAVVRLKGNMTSKNYVMRDPVLLRISSVEHYRHKKKYRVWPLYDFENAIEDATNGVTHVLRSIEFGEMRVELQDHLKQLFGFVKPTTIQYGRFNVVDSITQGREIRELIEKKIIKDWDDPRLVTLKALKRRGILPQALRDLAIEVGLSKTQTNLDWDMISSYNRKYLDASSERYFFIDDPVKVSIKNAPAQTVTLKTHPEAKKASRVFNTGTDFYISKRDAKSFKDDEFVRLMDCLNFVKKGRSYEFVSTSVDDFKKKGRKIIHWLPAEEVVEKKVLLPDASTITGLAEKNSARVKEGQTIQFTRFGFCKREGDTFIFAHK